MTLTLSLLPLSSCKPFSLPCLADKCTETAFSTLVNRMIALTPFFGVVFMAGHWLFLLTSLLGLIYSVCKRKPQAIQLQDEESDTESF